MLKRKNNKFTERIGKISFRNFTCFTEFQRSRNSCTKTFGFLYNKNGFAALYITLLVMAFVFATAVSIFILTFGEEKISLNAVESSQSYYASDAGIEDALWRLSKDSQWSKDSDVSWRLEVNGANATATVTKIIGGSRTITSEGNMKNKVRKTKVVYEVRTERVSFHYGAQIGEGGVVLYNQSEIRGNIFSNGSINLSGGGSGKITNDAILASTSTTYGNNKINGLEIGANAYAYSCQNSEIAGKLYLVGSAVGSCTAEGGTATSSAPVAKKFLPLSQSQIGRWETEASSSEIWPGNYEVGSGDTESFGPRKIEGSLRIRNNGTLVMKGTLWVAGTTTIENGATVKLDPNSYGSKSGVLIADPGRIIVENGAILEGSGEAGSYIMLLSTNSSQSEDDPAIFVKNNAVGAIFYTTQGSITLNNGMNVREVAGYKIFIRPNAVIEYETGLIDTFFTSGSGGSWEVASWRETE